MKRTLCVIISAFILTSAIITAQAARLSDSYICNAASDENTDTNTDTEHVYGGENYVDIFDSSDILEYSDSDNTLIIISDNDSERESTDATVPSDSDITTDSLTDTETVTSDTNTETYTQTDSDIPVWLPGDIDLNGEVNMLDVVCLQRSIAKLCELDGIQELAADVDYDNERTMKDVVLIQKYIAKLITRFSVREKP